MKSILQLKEEEFFTNKETSLRKPSELVIDFSHEFQKEVDNLLDTFYNWSIAVGISAPQIGINKRVSVINLDKTKKEDTLVVVNPIIISESGKKEKKKESCLSIPNYRGTVERRHKLHISFQNRFGEQQEMNVEGFLARVFFHEIDHLDGILFVDRMDKDSELEYVDFKWE